MGYTPSLDISVRFTAPVERVWDAIVDRTEFATWWPDGGHIEARKGGELKLTTPRPKKKRDRMLTGKVVSVEPYEKIVIDVNAQPRDRDTRLTLIFSQLKHKSRLRIVEEGSDSPTSGIILQEAREGWREVLAELDKHLAEK